MSTATFQAIEQTIILCAWLAAVFVALGVVGCLVEWAVRMISGEDNEC